MMINIESYIIEDQEEFLENSPNDVDIKKIDLGRYALRLAFEQLLEIRINKVGTHQEGVSVGFLFKKALGFFKKTLRALDYSEVARGIKKGLVGQIDTLERFFEPIFEVLTFDSCELTKREKNLMIRAYWKRFGDYYGECFN